MSRSLLAGFLCVLLSIPRVGWAGVPVCDPGNSKKCAVELKQGEPAPFTGQLLTPELAIDLAQKPLYLEELHKLDLARTSSIGRMALEHERELHRIDTTRWQREAELYRNLYESRVGERSWWDQPVIIASGAILCTILLFWVSRTVAKASN